MRSLIGTLWPDVDYDEISAGVFAVKYATSVFKGEGARIEIPTEHRYWEYGTAVQMLLNEHKGVLNKVEVLDVGSGWGAFGPTLAYLYGTDVTEFEPGNERHDRVKVNKILAENKRPEILVYPFHTDNMPNLRMYDMVACISVIEHMPPDVEQRAWGNLIGKLKPGGLFFADVDCVPEAGKKYTFDEYRAHNFTIPELKERVEHLISLGMEPIGDEPDYEWHGAQVHDFTFFRIGMKKLAISQD